MSNAIETSPLLQDLVAKHNALIAASDAVLRFTKSDDGRPGQIAQVLDDANREFTNAQTVLGVVFKLPKEALFPAIEKLIQAPVGQLYRAMVAGRVSTLEPFPSFSRSIVAMEQAHRAWGDARTAASQASAKAGQPFPTPTHPATTPPATWYIARQAADDLDERIHDLLDEQVRIQGFAEVFDKALATQNWSLLDDWQAEQDAAAAQPKPVRRLGSFVRKPIAASEPVAPVASALQGIDQALATEPVAAEPPPSLEDEIVVMDLFDDPDGGAAPIAEPVTTHEASDDSDLHSRVIVDLETGEILNDEPMSARSSEPTAYVPVVPVIEHDQEHDAEAKRAESMRLFHEAKAASDAANAMPDFDTDEEHDAPRAGNASDGFNPVALMHKHFVPLAAGAAVLVLGVAFLVGHHHRATLPSVQPVAAPVAPAPVIPAAPMPAPASVPAAVPAPVASGPVMTPVPTTAHAPALEPSVAPAPVLPAPVAAPAPVKPVVKAEEHKPARPVVHEHVTTMRETDEALDRLRSKLGE